MNLADVDPKYTAMCSERTLQEEEKGFFNKLVESCIENTNIEDWALTMWSKNTYGIQFIGELLKEQEIFDKLSDIFCVEPVFRKKNMETSNRAKNLAMKEMKDSNFQKALLLLNQAVIFLPTDIPHPESPLGLLLWFRSECLMELNKYDLALSDLQVAIKIPQVLENRGSFFYRQGECYKKTAEFQRAKISFNLALKFLNDNSSLYETAKNEIDVLNQEKITNDVKPNNDSLKADGEKNTQDVCKEYLNIAEEEGMGRFLIAKKDIAIGEKILAEEPYAACLKFNSYGTHCYHCFERLQISYGCLKCANLAFCSIKCRDAALDTYHKYECSFMDLFIGSGMSILCIIALRMVTQLGLQKALEIYEKYFSEKISNPSKSLNNNSLDDEESLIYNLCTHVALREPMDHLKRFFMAFFLFRCLQKSSFFSNEVSKTDNCTLNGEEKKILTLLLHNVQMLQFNAHEIEELLPPEMRKKDNISTRTIGVGIYPKVSLLNHDCYQGVARYFIGKKIIMRTIKPVPTGTMVPENYGPIFTKRTKYARQRVLRSRYWFKCNCMSCVEIWPDLDQLPQNNLPMFRCPNQNCMEKINLENVNGSCVECGTIMTSDFVQQRTILFNELCMAKYEKGVSFFNSGKYDEAVNVLTEALEIFHKHAYPPHFETHQAEQNLRLCFIALNQID